jgi:hypothetical protein
MLMVLRRLWGHVRGAPRGVFDQSISRMRAPISPPPARNVSCERLTDDLFIRQSPEALSNAHVLGTPPAVQDDPLIARRGSGIASL